MSLTLFFLAKCQLRIVNFIECKLDNIMDNMDNIRKVLVFGNFGGGLIREFKNLAKIIIIYTKEKEKFTNSKLRIREKSQNQKFAKI